MSARWRPSDGKGPGLELRSGKARIVVELTHYGYYAWQLQLDTGLIDTPAGRKRRNPGDTTSPIHWIDVEFGHTHEGMEVAKRDGLAAAAALREDLEVMR